VPQAVADDLERDRVDLLGRVRVQLQAVGDPQRGGRDEGVVGAVPEGAVLLLVLDLGARRQVQGRHAGHLLKVRWKSPRSVRVTVASGGTGMPVVGRSITAGPSIVWPA